MSLVRFAAVCDDCGARAAEYTLWPYCDECHRDICPACAVTVWLRELEHGPVLACRCRSCADADDDD